MRLIALIAAALSLFISTPAFAQGWIEYNNQEDFFSIAFPGQPTVRNATYTTESSINLPARVHSHQNGPSRYSVTVVDYTVAEKLHAEAVKKCKSAGGEGDLCNDRTAGDLRGAIMYATANLIKKSAKVTHLGLSNADRVEGHEVYLTNTDGSRTIAGIYMHENRLYILEGTVPESAPPPALFYQSIGFLDKDGKRIRYHSIYTNGLPAPPRDR